jgi:hypothetical protein
MLKVENAESGERDQTQKGEKLITPLHERDVEGGLLNVKPTNARNPLSGLLIVGKVRHGGPGHTYYSRRLGH